MELIIRIDKDSNAHWHIHTIKNALSKVFFDVNLRFTYSIDEGKYQYMVIEVQGLHGKSMHTQMSVLDKIRACIHMYVCTHQDTSAHLIEVFDTAKADWLEFIV